MVVTATFHERSLVAQARERADREIHDRATPADVDWLYRHPLLWLKALAQMRHDVANHIAVDRKSLATLKPLPGTHATAEFLTAKAEIDARSRGRIYFMRKVEARTEEIRALLGPHPLDVTMRGQVVEIMLRLEGLAADDDIEAVRNMAGFYAREWAKP